jgi:outer membrane protein
MSPILLALIAASTTATKTLTLREAVELAIAAQPGVDAAGFARRRTELAVLRAQLDRFSFKVDAQLLELWSKSNIGSDRDEIPDGALGLSNLSAKLDVPIFAGFRVEANVDRARHLDAAALADLERERNDTALAVARAYWALRKLGLLHEVQAKALARLRDAEAIAGSRVNAGLAPPIDQNRAASRRMLQEAALADLEGQLEEAGAALGVTLGIEDSIVLVDSPRAAEELPPPVPELLAAARAGRPELRAAERRRAAQAEAVRIAESGWYPQLAAFSLFEFGNNPVLAGVGTRQVFGTANPFDNMAGDFQVGATVSINLFDTLSTHTAVKDAEYEEARLGAEAQRAERIVEAEVRAARAKVAHHHRVRARLLPAEQIARDNVRIIQRRYENGEALVLELLDSEIELLNVERQLADTVTELQLAWNELDGSLGAVIGGDE